MNTEKSLELLIELQSDYFLNQGFKYVKGAAIPVTTTSWRKNI